LDPHKKLEQNYYFCEKKIIVKSGCSQICYAPEALFLAQTAPQALWWPGPGELTAPSTSPTWIKGRAPGRLRGKDRVGVGRGGEVWKDNDAERKGKDGGERLCFPTVIC